MIFCSRRIGNGANERGNACEERVVYEKGERALRGDEARCHTCGRVTALTFGVHGNMLVGDDGRCWPDPTDPRNRGIETGDAMRARMRSL